LLATSQSIKLSPGLVAVSGDVPSKGSSFLSDGNYVAPVNAPSIFKEPNLIGKGTENFVNKARDTISSSKGMTSLGELRETIHMLKHPISSLRKGIHDYVEAVKNTGSQYRNRRSKSFKGVLADTWLEYSFGWSPFIADINGLVSTAQSLGMKSDSTPVRSGQKISSSTFSSIGSTFGSPYLPRLTQTTTLYESSISIYGHVRTVPGSNTEAVMTDFGFTAEEFIPTIWELIPYSFLVDYFSNIGNIISVATFAKKNVGWVSSTETYTCKRTSFSKLIPHSYLPGSGSQSWTAESKLVERKPTFIISVPEVRVQLPNLPRQHLNLAALFTSARSTQSFLQRR